MKNGITSLLLILLLFAGNFNRQEGDYYSLLKRARNLDESIDFTVLRQAYAASPDFNPYPYRETKKHSRGLFNLLADKKYHRVIDEAGEILLQDQLDVLAHKALAVAFEKVGNGVLAKRHNFMAQGLLRSLVNSGDGQSVATAFRVISVDEEYALLQLLELGELVAQALVKIDSVDYDVLTVREPKTVTSRKYYFNIEVPSTWLSANLRRKIFCDSVAALRMRSKTLFNRGDIQAGLDAGEKALAVAVQNLDARDPEIAQTQLRLGWMYTELREREKARERLGSLKKVLEEKYGGDYLQLAFVYMARAWSAGKDKEFEDAEEAYRLAMKIVEGSLGKENSTMAVIENGLAGVYVDEERYAEAERHAKNALRLNEIIRGQMNLETADDIHNLAETIRLQNRYTEAEPLYHKAIAITENLLGNNHPRLLVSLENLAMLYGTMQRYKEAEALYVRCLAIADSTYGSEHDAVKYFRKMVADTQAAQRQAQ